MTDEIDIPTEPRAAVDALATHLTATADRPVPPATNRWLGEAEAENPGYFWLAGQSSRELGIRVGRVKFGVNCGRRRGLRANFELSRAQHC